jgi:hypothetical protein
MLGTIIRARSQGNAPCPDGATCITAYRKKGRPRISVADVDLDHRCNERTEFGAARTETDGDGIANLEAQLSAPNFMLGFIQLIVERARDCSDELLACGRCLLAGN